jgi:hypothetical protein
MEAEYSKSVLADFHAPSYSNLHIRRADPPADIVRMSHILTVAVDSRGRLFLEAIGSSSLAGLTV